MKKSESRHCPTWNDHVFELQLATETYRCFKCLFTVNGKWFEALDPIHKHVKE